MMKYCLCLVLSDVAVVSLNLVLNDSLCSILVHCFGGFCGAVVGMTYSEVLEDFHLSVKYTTFCIG